MSIRFIYGRAGSGKTRFCLEEIKSSITAGIMRPLVLLVPEQFTYQAERDLITVLRMGGILKTEVLSFRRLAFRVFNEAGGITYPHIHPAGKCMILFRLLDKMKEDLKIFSRSADRPGFVNTLAGLITEFKRYEVPPEALEDAANRFFTPGEANPGGRIAEGVPAEGGIAEDGITEGLLAEGVLRDKLKELASVYAAFEKILAERYRDSDDDLSLASKKLAATSLYDGAEIWIDGFDGFTPQEFAVIGQLLQKAQRVNVSFCTDCLPSAGFPEDEQALGSADVFSPVKTAYIKLVKMAQKYNIPVEPAVHLNNVPPPRFRLSSELSHLEQNLYAYPYKVYGEKTRDIALFSSSGIFSEIEAAARDIIRLCRDRGLRYRDIAVVTGNLADYEKPVRVIFAEYGIPCFIDRKVDIVNHPLVRMVLSILDIFNDNWSYEAVFRYLKTGLTGIDQDSIDRLENYVLACGIRGSHWTRETDWDMIPGLIPDERSREEQTVQLESINRIRALIVAPLLEFREKTRGRRKASDFCASLYDFLCALGVPERMENIIERFKKDGNLDLAREYSQVWNIVMEVFDQAAEVMGDDTFGIEKFTGILKIGFNEYKVGLIPASLDQVLVGSLERSRSHEVKALYILGANDGVFPPAAPEEGILSDRDRAALSRTGIELAGDTRSRVFDGQYLVYRALTTAAERLRISWPIADLEGRSMRPSMTISRIRKLFPAIAETSNILSEASASEELELLSCRVPAFKAMIAALRRKADGKEILPVWQDVYRWFAAQEEWRQKCRAVRAAFGYKNLAQPVGREKIAALYGEPAISSVSRLERYAACPFAFYVQYGLGAREREVYRLTPPDVGTFLHAVIEKFSRIVASGGDGVGRGSDETGPALSWRSFDREWCSAKVSEIVDGMLREMRGAGITASKRYTALAMRLKRVAARAVWTIAEHIRRSAFDPIDYEAGFGESAKYPPITVELDSGEKILLTGRIDRIDAMKTGEGTYLRIVDYKSGVKDFRLSDVYYGLQVQLTAYLDAIWEKECIPGGMLYFRVDDPVVKGDGRTTGEEIERAIIRQLRMRGLLLADVKLIRAMDNTIEGASLIIPATVNKGDALGRNTSAATIEQFGILRNYVRRLLKDLCQEMMKGNVSINPYKKKGSTACGFCSYLPVCQFDMATKDNAFRLLYDKDDNEVWRLMGESE